jgi:magnesium transporter
MVQNYEINELIIDQISIIIMKNVLLTFQELSRGFFDNIRKKLLDGIGEIRKMETDYLAYLMIDTIVDEYFNAINHLEEHIENLEEYATQTNDNTYIENIQETKKYLLQIKRAILPLKDNLLIISRHETFFQTEEIKPFLQDLNENLNHAVTQVEHYREWLSNIMEVNVSVL